MRNRQFGSGNDRRAAGGQWTITIWFDFLCANHVRNLPIDEFNRLFEQYIKANIGEELSKITRDGNRRARVEASGLLLFRTCHHPVPEAKKEKFNWS